MKISALFLLFTLAVSSRLASRALAAPVGMAAQVNGTVSMSQGGQKTPLRLLSRIEDGAAVTCGPNSGATIVLFSGGERYRINANSSAKFMAGGVKGAKKLAALSGPSAGAVKLLGNARIGAVLARPAISFQPLEGNIAGLISTNEARFSWQPIPDASRYTFTLFDGSDNVVWSNSSPETSTTYPALAAPLTEKMSYLWKVSGFNASGKRLLAGRWGFVTALSPADSQTLQSLAADLQGQAKATPADKTPLLILVDVYRTYGAVNLALNLLESEELRGVPGALSAKTDLLDAQSPFARVLAGRAVPAAH